MAASRPTAPLTACSLAVAVAVAVALSACAGGERPPAAQDTLAGDAASMTRALWEMADNARRNNDFEAAARHYATLLEAHPDSEAAILGRARTLRYAGKPYDAVLFLDAQIARLGPRPALTLELAKAHLADDAPAKALPLLTALAGSQPATWPHTWEVHSALGVLHDREGRMAEGLAEHERAFALAPLEPQTANNLALALAMDGRIDQAVATLTTVAKRSDAPVNALQNLALFHALRGDMERAEPLVRRALPPDLAEQSLRSLRLIASQARTLS